MASMFRRNRPKAPGGSPLTQLIGYGLVVGAVVFFYLSSRTAAPTFGFDEESLPEVWNGAATDLGRGDLWIEALQPTEEEEILGFRWTEDLLLLARVDSEATPPRPILELAAVGSPRQDGTTTVLDVLELVVAVARPELDGAQRDDILEQLSLVADNRPATIDAVLRSGLVEFRSTSDDEGEIGIGAVPLLDTR